MSDATRSATQWCDDVRAAVGRVLPRTAWLNRVLVLEEAPSTQDAARELAAGQPGLLVIARSQTKGRGRLGRAWEPTQGQGLAATFVLDATDRDGGRLSIMAGLGACLASEAALGKGPREVDTPKLDLLDWAVSPGPTAILDMFDIALGRGQGHVALRWPNDVVRLERDGAPGDKLAGVLIERTGNLFLVGIGMNVLQTQWPAELTGRAVSLRQLGSRWSVADAAAGLVLALNTALHLDDAALRSAWAARDALYGRRCTFETAGVRYTGRVMKVDPTSEIELMDEARGPVRLPADTTSLISVGGAP